MHRKFEKAPRASKCAIDWHSTAGLLGFDVYWQDASKIRGKDICKGFVWLCLSTCFDDKSIENVRAYLKYLEKNHNI